MNRALTVGLLAVTIAIAALVLAGVGQGAPPAALPINAAAIHREEIAVNNGSAIVHRGQALFSSHGCNACHTMAAGRYTGRLGPRLDVQTQGDAVKDVVQNIISPPDDDKGYEAGLMPDDLASRFSHSDIVALATYIHTAAAAAAGPKKTGSGS